MLVKPYGDTTDDGAVQLSFTLPMQLSPKAEETARMLVLHLGCDSCEIVSAQPLSNDMTFFIAYGKTSMAMDTDLIEAEKEPEFMSFDEINEEIKKSIARRITVVGACTGSDAHTVGIDGIMNMKGYNHHFGLERYPMIQAHNLGAQVENKELLQQAQKLNADAVLISQIVTKNDVHITNLTEFIEIMKQEDLYGKMITVIGGPKITNKLAVELGYDAGFGRGTYAEHVATFILRKLIEKG